jgi:hypothetical protein
MSVRITAASLDSEACLRDEDVVAAQRPIVSTYE